MPKGCSLQFGGVTERFPTGKFGKLTLSGEYPALKYACPCIPLIKKLTGMD